MKIKIKHKTGAVIIKELTKDDIDCIKFESVEKIFLESPDRYRISYCKFCDCENVEEFEFIKCSPDDDW